MKPSTKNTAHYAAIQSFYWLTNMPILAFGPMYLYSLGLSNISVGFFLAAASLVSIVLQPLMGSLIDRGVLTLRQAAFLHVGILFVLGVILNLPLATMKIAAHFLMLVLIMGLQPFVNTLSIDAVHTGIPLDFGIARGIASLMYGIVSLLLGRALGIYSTSLIPLVALSHLTVFAIVFWLFPNTVTADVADEPAPPISSGFHRSFLLMLLATFFLFVNHGALNNFLLRIVENVGGGSAEFGMALGISAVVELPIMASFTHLKNRFGTPTLLRISSTFFFIKAILLVFAVSPFYIYLNQLLQAFTFGLFFPTAVTYVQEILPFSLRARSQALLISTITFGGVVASLLGGAILDYLHVKALLISGVVFSALGFFCILLLKEKKSP
jgi:PPP family 3-phenylpropionic acid transporter